MDRKLLFDGRRIRGETHPLMKHFGGVAAGLVNKGLHWFDKAHAVMLTEEGIIPRDIGIQILNTLREMDKEGIDKVRNALGGGSHCGELYITQKLGSDIGGWIHPGRSSADLSAVSKRVLVRDGLINYARELNNLRQILLEKAEEHIDTVMPGYSHIQHAEPITFGFYLLSWLHQFERDFERFQGAYKHMNVSPAGCAVLTTTDYPLNRQRTQELLGFDGIQTNAEEANQAADYLVESFSCLVITTGILARFAEDLYVWSSSEFNMIEISDAYCGTSSIMPQKRNAQGLEAVRWLASVVIGDLVSFLVLIKGQSWAREWAPNSPSLISDAFDKCLPALQLMGGMVKDLEVNKELMKERAGMFWTTATSLANNIQREKGIPYRHAHHVVAILVRLAYEEGKSPKDVTSEMVDRASVESNGQPLNLGDEFVSRSLDPAMVVKSKKIIGGTAPERIKEDIADRLERLGKDQKIVASLEAKLDAASEKLESAIDKLVGK